MKVTDTRLAGVKRIELDVFDDERGYFVENFQAQRYAGVLGCVPIADQPQAASPSRQPSALPFFVQDNSSFSKKGVLRGLHFQRRHPQGKLIHVSHGKIFDVAVDLRRDSPTFGQSEGVVLQGAGPQLWIPAGFAHGFVVLSDAAMVHYKCTDYYYADDQACLHWNDPDLAINWPIANPVLSQRDSQGESFSGLLEQGFFPEKSVGPREAL